MKNCNPTYEQLLSMFNEIQNILETKTHKAYEKMTLITVSFFKTKYGQAFPEYETLAAMGGMSKRKAQYSVKHLEGLGEINKQYRFVERADGKTRQTSNQYDLELNAKVDAQDAPVAQYEFMNAWDAPENTSACAYHAPYGSKALNPSSFRSLESFSFNPSTDLEEESYTPCASAYACDTCSSNMVTKANPYDNENYAYYENTYQAMLQASGRVYLTEQEREYLDVCEEYYYSPELAYAYLQTFIHTINEKPVGTISATFERLEIRKEREQFEQYFDVYEAMSSKDGGLLSFNHKEFLLTCQENKIASIVAKKLYESLGDTIDTCSYKALVASLTDLADRFKSGLINRPVEWFKTKLDNEILRYAA